MPTTPPMPPRRAHSRSDRPTPAIYFESTVSNKKPGQLREDWLSRVEQSTFLTIKYGLVNAEGALDQLSRLKANWDSYGSEPPADLAVRRSRETLIELTGDLLLPSAIVPSADGGVSIYFINGPRSAYVESYNEGSQALVMYDSTGRTEVLEIGRDIMRGDVGHRILEFLG